MDFISNFHPSIHRDRQMLCAGEERERENDRFRRVQLLMLLDWLLLLLLLLLPRGKWTD